MCGIFGIIGNKGGADFKSLVYDINRLFKLSESRGKEASGIAISYYDSINIMKMPVPASDLLKTREYNDFIRSGFPKEKILSGEFRIIGHSRLVTNGTEEISYNNQPVVKKGYVVIHNGIITNVNELTARNPEVKKDYGLDTEIIPELMYLYKSRGLNLLQSAKTVFGEIEGTVSVCMLSDRNKTAILYTNNGSLYYSRPKDGYFVFSSEKYILSEYLSSSKLFGASEIKQVMPGVGIHISSDAFDVVNFISGDISDYGNDSENEKPFKLKMFSREEVPEESSFGRTFNIKEDDLLEFNIDSISKLKSCSKCILPETFPFIEFDEHGVCNYCRSYKRKYPTNQDEKEKKLSELYSILEKYRRKNGYEVIVPFSGGRDSSYGLYYMCRELKLKPVTFTYDWGMVTDLARRNIARMCGKLGVENILVSADIRKKRRNIRENVTAWLKKPELGIIPLFMAGDKHFFYYVNVLKKQNNIDLNIWMTNSLENTDFKSGFAGIRPDFNKERIYDLTLSKNLQLVLYYWRNFAANPSYLNSSLTDTFSSYMSYYFSGRKDYLHLFDYIYWDESIIENILLNEFKWEKSPDTESTWRIGDGTASFYNYIYYTVSGFTENDTFRSNQVREGMIDRETALDKSKRENFPRPDSIRWYCDTIGLDFENTIKTINKIPKLYSV